LALPASLAVLAAKRPGNVTGQIIRVAACRNRAM
jgi:hypothetical protein